MTPDLISATSEGTDASRMGALPGDSLRIHGTPDHGNADAVANFVRQSAHESYYLLGTRVNALRREDLDALVEQHVESKQKVLIANHNLHSLYVMQKDERMRGFYDKATYTHIDGMSLIALGRLAGIPLNKRHRTGYMDWLPHLLKLAWQRKWTVYFLGSTPEVLEKALSKMQKQWPGISVRGHDGYFDKRRGSLEGQRVLAQIRDVKANIVMVGMGMPVQERWIVENFSEIDTQVVLHCGGMLNFYSGELSTPPRWLGQLGLEWFYRLCTEPTRLWKRYLLEPLLLLGMLSGRRLQFARFREFYDEDLC